MTPQPSYNILSILSKSRIGLRSTLYALSFDGLRTPSDRALRFFFVCLAPRNLLKFPGLVPYKLLVCVGCLCVLCLGCYKVTPPVVTLSEANQKLVQIFEEDLEQNAIITPLEHTLYIYVPIKFDIFVYQASRTTAVDEKHASFKKNIAYLNVEYRDQSFAIDYDIETSKSYPQPKGYASSYTEEFSKLHNNILTSIYRSYGDLLEKSKEPPKDFIVLILADTRNGIGIRNTFSYQDLKKGMGQALAQEEYAKRYMTEMFGDISMKNDEWGQSVDYKDLTWTEFVAKEIQYRISYDFGRTVYPLDKPDEEILKALVMESISAYDFTDYSGIVFDDISKENNNENK